MLKKKERKTKLRMLDQTFDIGTRDEIIVREVPEDIVMTVVKSIMTTRNEKEVVISEHVYQSMYTIK